MKPFQQIILGTGEKEDPPGDCFRTCIASILEIDIESLPNFVERPDWLSYTQDFLNENYGLNIIQCPNSDGLLFPENFYYIEIGLTPYGCIHAVVSMNGKMVHDPHPDATGLSKTDYFIFIVQSAKIKKLKSV